MGEHSILYSLFLIFTGAAAMATVALYARQALIIAYIALGVILGPSVLGLVTDTDLISDISGIGIIFLLFLLGLHLSPNKLIDLLKQTTIVGLLTSLSFAAVGFAFAVAVGFPIVDSIVVGVASMFSSTIIGLKLLPTTVLHHRHTGEVIISVLLLQDIIAIVVLLGLQAAAATDVTASNELGSALGMATLKTAVAFPLLVVFAWAVKDYVLLPLIRRFDKIQEYIFLLAIAWCVGIAQLAHSAGLSYESGAFVAGVTIASSPIALFIAESLKPLRDFFLVLFFFALGAAIQITALQSLWLPAVLFGLLMLAIKPPVFRYALRSVSETNRLGWETGVRLGQMSEFSLLIVFLALQHALIESNTAYFVQLATVVTFIGSSFYVVRKYPTPVATSDALRRD